MNEFADIAMDTNSLSRDKIAAANRAIFEAIASFRDVKDPAAHIIFGMGEEQFNLVKNMTTRDAVKLSTVGMTVWLARFEMRPAHPGSDAPPVLDMENVVDTLLRSFPRVDIGGR
jgi:hypothetical protein